MMRSDRQPALRRPTAGGCSVIELRQYTLYPGKRDVLIALFDREFVETQEAEGMLIIGQFRDLDNPNRFVWVRGFRDMLSRQRALAGFYGGPVWQRHRDVANATMEDSSNALLLRPVSAASTFRDLETSRPPAGSDDRPSSLVVATIFHRRPEVGEEFTALFEQVRSIMADAGGPPVGGYESETAQNTFPALPVRTGENLFVSFARFTDTGAYQRHLDALSTSTTWHQSALPTLMEHLTAAPQHLKLAPTSRSLLR